MFSFLQQLKLRNQILYNFGWCCLLAMVVCIILIVFTQRQVLGINAWYKPMKFFLSSAIYAWTMGWLLYHLPVYKQVYFFSWIIVIVLAFETIYIALQAGRGMLSHFNTSSALYGIMFSLMGIAITIMTIGTGYMAMQFFLYKFPQLPASYLWGIRLGMIVFVVFAFEGFLMASKLRHTVGAADGGAGLPVLNWSRNHGDLRVAHFFGMHALQLLPLFGWYVSRSTIAVTTISIFYFIAVTLLLIKAMAGRPFV
jgi:hypothetical protein